MDYRKIWEKENGPIPKDENGRTYDIHHIDGNRKNNSIENLMCVSIQEHYEIHLNNFKETGCYKEAASVKLLASRIKKNLNEISGYTVSLETRKKISKTLTGVKHTKERVNRMKKKLKGIKWSESDIEARRRGQKQYYKDASEEELRARWDKISKAHKGKNLSEETKLKLAKHNVKLKDEDVLEIYDLILKGVRYNVISEKYNISPAQITSIKQKKTYKWLWE